MAQSLIGTLLERYEGLTLWQALDLEAEYLLQLETSPQYAEEMTPVAHRLLTILAEFAVKAESPTPPSRAFQNRLNHLTGPCLEYLVASLKVPPAEGSHPSMSDTILGRLFALALLIPAPNLNRELPTGQALDRGRLAAVCRSFTISKRPVLERIAWARKALLLFWDHVPNPRAAKKEPHLRIMDVFPKGKQFTSQYIPLYCTAKPDRFHPNLPQQAFAQKTSNSGLVEITGLGTLSTKTYPMTNIYFGEWRESLVRKGLVAGRGQFFNMVSLVELGSEF